jgi:hypothetical protein
MSRKQTGIRMPQLLSRKLQSCRKLGAKGLICQRHTCKPLALRASSGWERACFRTACSTCSSPCRVRMRRKPPRTRCTAASVGRARKCCSLGIACSRSCGARACIFLSRHTACSNAAASDAHKRRCRCTPCTGSVACRAHRCRAGSDEVSACRPLLPASPCPALLASTPRHRLQRGCRAAAQRPALQSPESTQQQSPRLEPQQLHQHASCPLYPLPFAPASRVGMPRYRTRQQMRRLMHGRGSHKTCHALQALPRPPSYRQKACRRRVVGSRIRLSGPEHF